MSRPTAALSIVPSAPSFSVSCAAPANQNDAPPEALEIAMARFADGDDHAFATVFALAAPRLRGLFRRFGDGPAQAEDLVQETLLRVYRCRASYRKGARVMPWVYTIARRLVIDRSRRRRMERAADELFATLPPANGGAPRADEELAARRMAGIVSAVLASLPPGQAQAFRLVKEEGKSLDEAAAEMGQSNLALRLRTHRACKAIREALRDHL